MDATVISTIVSIVALVIAAYVIYKASQAGTDITPALIQGELVTATTTATELTEVALTAAQAAEQLYRTGKLAKSERLDHAFKYVKKWFPDLDQARIITAIEAGVFVVNTLVDALPNRDMGMTTKP